jgi:hypothetical protein
MNENALELIENLRKPGLARQRLVYNLSINDGQPLKQKLAVLPGK